MNIEKHNVNSFELMQGFIVSPNDAQELEIYGIILHETDKASKLSRSFFTNLADKDICGNLSI